MGCRKANHSPTVTRSIIGTETTSEIPVTCLSPKTLCLETNSSISYQEGPRSASMMGTGPLFSALTKETLLFQFHFCFPYSPSIGSKAAKHHACTVRGCWRCLLLVPYIYLTNAHLYLCLSHIDRSLHANLYW